MDQFLLIAIAQVIVVGTMFFSLSVCTSVALTLTVADIIHSGLNQAAGWLLILVTFGLLVSGAVFWLPPLDRLEPTAQIIVNVQVIFGWISFPVLFASCALIERLIR